MSAERRLNPSEFSNYDLDRLIFAITGRIAQTHVVERPLDRQGAADYIGISVSKFDRLRRAGIIKPHKIEKLTTNFYLPSELHELIKKS